MLIEFEVIYRETEQAPGLSNGIPVAAGDLKRFVMTAGDADAVRAVLEGQGFAVVQVTELYPVVNQAREVYNRDEAAAFLGIKPSTLTHKLGSGQIPWNASASGVEKAVLLVWLRKGYNAPALAIVKELEKAA